MRLSCVLVQVPGTHRHLGKSAVARGGCAGVRAHSGGEFKALKAPGSEKRQQASVGRSVVPACSGKTQRYPRGGVAGWAQLLRFTHRGARPRQVRQSPPPATVGQQWRGRGLEGQQEGGTELGWALGGPYSLHLQCPLTPSPPHQRAPASSQTNHMGVGGGGGGGQAGGRGWGPRSPFQVSPPPAPYSPSPSTHCLHSSAKITPLRSPNTAG